MVLALSWTASPVQTGPLLVALTAVGAVLITTLLSAEAVELQPLASVMLKVQSPSWYKVLLGAMLTGLLVVVVSAPLGAIQR